VITLLSSTEPVCARGDMAAQGSELRSAQLPQTCRNVEALGWGANRRDIPLISAHERANPKLRAFEDDASTKVYVELEFLRWPVTKSGMTQNELEVQPPATRTYSSFVIAQANLGRRSTAQTGRERSLVCVGK